MEKIVIDRDRLTLSLANLFYFFNAKTYRIFFSSSRHISIMHHYKISIMMATTCGLGDVSKIFQVGELEYSIKIT
jgi:hypothetical protein